MIRVESLDNTPVALVILDRAEQRNALTPRALLQLADSAQSAAKDSNALILTGAGPAFCAGFDLTLCQSSPDGQIMRELLSNLSTTIQTLRNLPIPVIAAAHGAAIAGGCALLGGADIIITNKHAKLGYPVVKLGISPAISAPFLAAHTTQGVARELLLNPTLISGSRAHEIGLATHLTKHPDDVLPLATQIAQSLAAKPAHALAATKSWLNELDGASSHDASNALAASLALTGSDEERALLPLVFKKGRP